MAMRPDLDGLRIRMPGTSEVYVVDQGKKRHIVDPFVYNQLFRNWENIHLDLDVAAIDTGTPLAHNAILFKCVDSPKVFLLDGNVKRWIQSPEVMDRFQFNWSTIQHWNVPLNAVGYADGVTLTKTGRPD